MYLSFSPSVPMASTTPGSGIVGGGDSFTLAATPTAAPTVPLGVGGALAGQAALTQQPAALAYAAPAATAPVAATTGGGATDVQSLVPVLQALVGTLTQLVTVLQAQQGAATVQGGGPTAGGCGCSAHADAAAGAMGAPTAETPAPAPAPTAAAGSPSSLTPSDAQLAAKLDDTVLKGTGLAGKGAVIVESCRKYGIPVDFMLAVYRKEANFAKAGTLADRNNNPGNLRFADWQAEHGGAPNGGFTKYPTIDDGIRASVHLLSMGSYKSAIDRRDWGAVISRYAPSSENDTATYIREMNEWTADYRTKLGISEHWVHGG